MGPVGLEPTDDLCKYKHLQQSIDEKPRKNTVLGDKTASEPPFPLCLYRYFAVILTGQAIQVDYQDILIIETSFGQFFEGFFTSLDELPRHSRFANTYAFSHLGQDLRASTDLFQHDPEAVHIVCVPGYPSTNRLH